MLGNGFIASKVLTARKEHFCELCCCKINIEQKYKKVTGADENGISSSSYHTECSELFSRIHWTERRPSSFESDAFDCFIYDYIDEHHRDEPTGIIENDWKNLSKYDIIKKVLEEIKEKNITNIEY